MKLIILALLFLASCTTEQKAPEKAPESVDFKLSWDKPAWSKKVDEIVSAKIDVFSQAKDIETFCPKYKSLSLSQKKIAVGELIVSMVKYESGFNPSSKYMEPAPLYYYSVGLLQLSYEDKKGYPFCNLDKAKKNLEDPINNLDCGVQIIAKLVGKHGYISGLNNKGANAYWSVLRPLKSGQPRASYNGIIKHVQTKAPGCK